METATSKAVKLKDEEQEILNELFFLSSFKSVLSNTSLNQKQIEKALVKLIENKLVRQMVFDDTIKDYVETKSLENIADRAYIITKKGLSNHIYG